MIDPFRLCLILGPLAIYCLLIGAVNLGRRPLLVAGTRDLAALGLALSGLIVVGPMELFLPEAAAIRFGAAVWLLLLLLYGLCLILVLLCVRPRLVIYNIGADQLRPILAELVATLDREARWAGDSLAMPSLGVQLTIESWPLLRNVTLAGVGPSQTPEGWRKLEAALQESFRRVEVGPTPFGIALLSVACLMLAAVVWIVARDPGAVSRSLFQMVNL